MLGLIEAKINIIECKRVDANANKKKPNAWKTIYEGHISKYGNFRLISQIKDQWHFKVLRRILVDLTEKKRWPSFIYTKRTVHANTNKQFSILFYSILFYSILFYSILFYSILFYSILFYSILFYKALSLMTLIH